MAEGDSILRLARRLDGELAGRTVVRSEFRVARHATADLSGREVLAVVARGKHLLQRFSGGLTLHTHLRMQGAWRVLRPALRAPRPGAVGSDGVRVVLVFDVLAAVGARLPVVDLLPTAQEARLLAHLGPDLLGPDWYLDVALRRLLSDPRRPLVQALLDQRNLAGFGNLYAVEGCFLGRVSPWTPVGETPDLPGLVTRLRDLLAANAMATGEVRSSTVPGPARGGQRTTGAHGRLPAHWVYGRYRRPCLRCRTPVAFRPAQPPTGRETWFCPSCQPGPVPVAAARSPRSASPRGVTR